MLWLWCTKLRVVRSKVKVHQTFDAAFSKILNVVGDICDKTCCHIVLFCVATKFLRFDLSQSLCTRFHDIDVALNKFI